MRDGGDPKRVCNLLTQTGLKLANEKGCTVAQLAISAANLARLAEMADSGQISATSAATIFEEMTQSDRARCRLRPSEESDPEKRCRRDRDAGRCGDRRKRAGGGGLRAAARKAPRHGAF